MVLLDADEEDCRVLKARLEDVVREVGMTTKSAVLPGLRFRVLNRIAVEELEAWYFGDVEALRAVYPRISPNLAQRRGYRDPDAISGGTWEALHRLLTYHRYSVPGKITLAEQISRHMDPKRNRSHSFQMFMNGLQAILQHAS